MISISFLSKNTKGQNLKLNLIRTEKSFKINDSITIKGFAKTFSGANITDAKVVYRVYRKAQYPSWYSWYRPNPISETQEITNGESSTDTSGNFEIKFKAIPDENVLKENLPVFNYEITARCYRY